MDDQTQPGQPIQPWAPPGEPAAPPAPPSMDAAPPGPEAAAAAPPVPPVSWGAAPAVAPGIPVPGAPGVFFASMWARFAAFLVDGLIIALIDLVFSIIVRAALGGSVGTTQTPFGRVPIENPAAVAITAVIGVVVTFLYFTTQWRGAHRATFGMRAFSVQIGNAFDGIPLNSRQAMLRWVALGHPLGLLSAFGTTAGLGVLLTLVLELALFLTTLGSTTRQGWHDQLANSAVIRRPGSSGSNSAAIAIAVVLLVLVGIAFFAIVALIFLGGAISDILSNVGSSI